MRGCDGAPAATKLWKRLKLNRLVSIHKRKVS